jgi:hypothetical protein
LIDGAIGRLSLFHKTFGYYGDGVSSRTAIMPTDWREKDQTWLREAFRSGIANPDRTATLLRTELPDEAPAHDELERRFAAATTAPAADT